MVSKFRSFCVFAAVVQCISGQCIGNINGINLPSYGVPSGCGISGISGINSIGLANCGCGVNGLVGSNGCGISGINSNGFVGSNAGLTGVSYSNLAAQLAASNGGGFTVNSLSNQAPNGLSILSDNLLIEGPMSVYGQIPFLSAVSLDGLVPTAGQGSVAYQMGNGQIGILSEGNPGLVNGGGLVSNGYGLGGGIIGNGVGLGGLGCNGNGLGNGYGINVGVPNIGCGCGCGY